MNSLSRVEHYVATEGVQGRTDNPAPKPASIVRGRPMASRRSDGLLGLRPTTNDNRVHFTQAKDLGFFVSELG